MSDTHVLVMAKEPRPGHVKTRLCPPLSAWQAAEVAVAALADTLEAAAACGAARKIIALDGSAGPWLPAGFEVIAQRGDGLGERLANAWSDAGGPGVQIGMDTPQVSADDLDDALALLDSARPRAVLGHADDGGWWAIGLVDADPHAVFRGIPMSTPLTGAHTEHRLRALGLDVALIPTRRDIDTVADLVAVAGAAPHSRTAAAAARLGLALPAGARA